MNLHVFNLSIGFLVGIQSALGAATGFVLVPGDSLTTEGNSWLAPLGSQLPSRFQQVDAASEFVGTIPAAGAYLGSIYLRTDGPLGNNFMTTISNLQITLSTTLRTPDGLSSTFADNLGSDATVVLGPRAELVQGAHGTPPGVPNPFATQLIFTTPFFYNPSAGNLLIDIRTSGYDASVSGPVSLFDAVDARGDSVSSVFSFNGNLVSGQTDTRGAVTLFTWGVVPEPSSLALLAPALAALWLFMRRRRNQTS